MKYNGLFIGLTTIDIQYSLEEFPKENTKVKTKPPGILIGGPATNAAVAFSHLNMGAFLTTAFGKNSFEKYFTDDLKITNTKHFDIIGNQNSNPVIATVVTSANNGNRTIFTHNPPKIKPNISPEELFKVVDPQIVLLDGFYPEFAIDCARLARKRQIPVVLDCGSWKPQYEELLNFADVAICSADFFPQNCVNSIHVFDYLKSKKVAKSAISRGGKSILFYDEKEVGEVIVNNCKVIDTLGAGDFLHGSFCYFYLQNSNFKNALTKASEIATCTCLYEGTRTWLNFKI